MVFLSTEQVFNGNAEPGPYTEDVHRFVVEGIADGSGIIIEDVNGGGGD